VVHVPEDQPLIQAQSCRPWSKSQVRIAESWPTRRGQPVSVALSPAADRLAWSVGQRLSVSSITRGSSRAPLLQLACALTPGLAWSPQGDQLAFRDESGQGRLIDLSRPLPVGPAEIPMESFGATNAIAFSPAGDQLATLAPSLPGRVTLARRKRDGGVVWESVLTRDRMSSQRSDGVNLAWSPSGELLACTIGTKHVWLIDAASGQPLNCFENHSKIVTGLDWIDDDVLLSASEDATLQLWRPAGSAPSTVVETIAAAGMVFAREHQTALIWSTEGELFAWSLSGTPTQLWHRNPPTRSVAAHFTRLAVSAVNDLLALVDAGATNLVLVSDWHRAANPPATTTTYANAKVLLLGDSGVGKSALAMVLAGQEFKATESTHGRWIWRLPTDEEPPDPAHGDRDVLLWDLAGQPGYRIVHQLHLGGASLALILFDSRSETVPLAGVRHWARAVRHAHPVAAGGLTTFLVAARIDRGGIEVSANRIERVVAEFTLDGCIKTSAKEGTNIDLLRGKLLAAIDWERIPKIASTALFAEVKRFVVDQKSAGHLLTPLDELSRDFQATVPSGQQLLRAEEQLPDLTDPDAQQAAAAWLMAVFEGCVERLESAGLVKRLKYWDYVLLQPELLDVYASAIVNAARDEPDGLGSILESQVINLEFPIPSSDRVLGDRQEQLLVLATLEELIRYELVLREPTEDGVQLVFPSAYRRDLPASEAPHGNGVVFRFEGPVENVYATLIVRLTRSNRFTRIATWQSAARFAADIGECTVFLKSDEGKAELWIGYDGVPDIVRLQFERFVHTHLERRATAGTVTRERQYSCPEDHTAFTHEQVEQVRNRGRGSILCPVCEKRVTLRDDYVPLAGTDQDTAEMDASADAARQSAAASAVLRGKEEVAEFDVFLCHNVQDKPAVRELAQQLRGRGLRPWLDERELQPGLPWQRVLEEQIQRIPAAIVVVGSRIGPWQDQELAAFLRQFVKRRCPVIPVLLHGAERPELPTFLDGMTWVDLAVTDPDPLVQLEWGITGRHPER
jgi:WD40 repeat protein